MATTKRLDLNWEELADKISEEYGDRLMTLSALLEVPEEDIIMAALDNYFKTISMVIAAEE